MCERVLFRVLISAAGARPGSLTKLPFRAGDRGMPRRLLSVLHQSVHVLCADQEVS